MERSEVEAKLVGLLVEELGLDKDKITMEASLRRTLKWIRWVWSNC